MTGCELAAAPDGRGFRPKSPSTPPGPALRALTLDLKDVRAELDEVAVARRYALADRSSSSPRAHVPPGITSGKPVSDRNVSARGRLPSRDYDCDSGPEEAEHKEDTREPDSRDNRRSAMPVWNEPEFARDFYELAECARKGVGQGPQPGEQEQVHYFGGAEWIALRGRGLELLRSLAQRLVGSSTADHGLSLKEAHNLLTTACSQAVDSSSAEALESLQQTLQEPIQEWLIAEPITLHIPTPKLVVGRCTLWQQAPPRMYRGAHGKELAARGELTGSIIATKVEARDAASATSLASEQIAESTAILDVVDRPRGRVRPENLYQRQEDGRAAYSFQRQGWILNPPMVEGAGRLRRPYLYAARAAGRDEDRRSEWERRVIGAMRWFSLGVRGTWTAARLVCLMAALESIFVRDKAVLNKGKAVAQGVSLLYVRSDLTPEQQRAWLGRLSGGRNLSIHEGRPYAHDLEVDRLADLTHLAVRWATAHLDPAHRPRGRSCRTFDQVTKCAGLQFHGTRQR